MQKVSVGHFINDSQVLLREITSLITVVPRTTSKTKN